MPSHELELLEDSLVSREVPVVVNLNVSRCFDVTFVCVPAAAHAVLR